MRHYVWLSDIINNVHCPDELSYSLQMQQQLLLKVLILKDGRVPCPINIEWEIITVQNVGTTPLVKPSR
jgi:hypothetical protein